MAKWDKETVEVPRRALFNALVVLSLAWTDGRLYIDSETADALNELCKADGMAWRFSESKRASR